jgi:hypothetical protein
MEHRDGEVVEALSGGADATDHPGGKIKLLDADRPVASVLESACAETNTVDKF